MNDKQKIILQLTFPFFISGVCAGWVFDYLLQERWFFAAGLVILSVGHACMGYVIFAKWTEDQVSRMNDLLDAFVEDIKRGPQTSQGEDDGRNN